MLTFHMFRPFQFYTRNPVGGHEQLRPTGQRYFPVQAYRRDSEYPRGTVAARRGSQQFFSPNAILHGLPEQKPKEEFYWGREGEQGQEAPSSSGVDKHLSRSHLAVGFALALVEHRDAGDGLHTGLDGDHPQLDRGGPKRGELRQHDGVGARRNHRPRLRGLSPPAASCWPSAADEPQGAKPPVHMALDGELCLKGSVDPDLGRQPGDLELELLAGGGGPHDLLRLKPPGLPHVAVPADLEPPQRVGGLRPAGAALAPEEEQEMPRAPVGLHSPQPPHVVADRVAPRRRVLLAVHLGP
mmetsp:Transcript_20484/g.48782  ORF Transcript_20484/g.48782 Transcript_20484/m.48782 type:complete len:298 (-) Transcript_20484:783-1676(-)